MYVLLTRSFINQQPIEVIYMNSMGQVSQRTIRVLPVTDQYVKAYCYVRHQMRTFKMENILSTGAVRKRVSA